MTRPMIVIAPLVIGAIQPLLAQRSVVRHYDATSYAAVQRTAYIVQRDFFHHDIPHYGKWVTAAGVAALTIMGAAEHRQSKRQWDQLLTICHSAQDACDCFVYFISGAKIRAPAAAQALLQRLTPAG